MDICVEDANSTRAVTAIPEYAPLWHEDDIKDFAGLTELIDAVTVPPELLPVIVPR